MMLWWALSAWGAAPDALRPAACEPLDEREFRALTLDAQSALDRDDAATHAQILRDIQGRIPCLGFAPPPRLWADYLVGLAISEFAAKGDWKTPLAAALALRPQIDRGVGPAHPMARWEPPASATSGAEPVPVPDGLTLWVDGAVVAALPEPSGLHLVQRQDQGQWVSLWLVEQPIPEGWLTARIVQPFRVDYQGQIGGFYETFAAWQRRNWPSDYVAQGSTGFGGPGGRIRAQASARQAYVLAHLSGHWPSFHTLDLSVAELTVGGRRGRTTFGVTGGLYGQPVLLGADCAEGEEAACSGDVAVELVEERGGDSMTGREAEPSFLRLGQAGLTVAWYGATPEATRGGATLTTSGKTTYAQGWWATTVDGAWYVGGDVAIWGGRYGQLGGQRISERSFTTVAMAASFEFGTRFGGSL